MCESPSLLPFPEKMKTTDAAIAIAHNRHTPTPYTPSPIPPTPMSGTFESNSIGWQIQLVQMRIAEWLDRLFSTSKQHPNSNWSLPEEFFRIAFWIIAALLIGWIGWQLYLLLRPYIAPYWLTRLGQSEKSAPSTATASLTASQWWQRSRMFAQQGNYQEACRALYLATLQTLDDQRLIPTAGSRTDGEYWRILQTLPNSQSYQVLFQTHERLCFSDRAISQQTFNDCEQAYREINAA